MNKKVKIGGFVFALVAFGLWALLFVECRESYQVVFPGDAFELYTLTDNEAGGFSTSEVSVEDSCINAEVNIRSGKAYPYAGFGFNLMSMHNRPTGYFDFTVFDSISVVVSTGRMRSITLRIMTDDPVYSKPNNYLSYRPLERELAVVGNSAEIKASLSDFRNKEWWLVGQGLDKDDGLTYLYRAVLLEVFNGENSLRGIPDEIEVRQIRMWGINRNFERGMYIVLVFMAMLLAGFVVMVVHKPKDKASVKSKMEKAAALLKSTDKSVAEIALELGMSSGNLEREFNKAFGKKPLEYRRKKDV